MRLERAFRLLDHVTLAAAGVCLIYAEQPFLPSGDINSSNTVSVVTV